ncbi:hypothetical protein AWC11_12080 [Mycobacterium interjectum]|nr:hypothetical protein AWC11_12080 [Mycobacterium interjectum]
MAAPTTPDTTTPDAHTALTHALQHLRHALRCVGRAIPDLDEGTLAAARCAALTVEIAAAAGGCAGILDHLDAEIDAAEECRPAGRAL